MCLRKFAIKYYGNSIFWVYIYEANKGKIANPDNVPLGAVLRIPKLDKNLLDLSNPETELRINQMKREILK